MPAVRRHDDVGECHHADRFLFRFVLLERLLHLAHHGFLDLVEVDLDGIVPVLRLGPGHRHLPGPGDRHLRLGEKDLGHTVLGAEIAPHLTRHGVEISVLNLPAFDGDVAETLRRHAKLTQADMIVMGAYVHSRLRQMVLSGATQSLLKDCPVPLFLSY